MTNIRFGVYIQIYVFIFVFCILPLRAQLGASDYNLQQLEVHPLR